jgi:hypothetical protein
MLPANFVEEIFNCRSSRRWRPEGMRVIYLLSISRDYRARESHREGQRDPGLPANFQFMRAATCDL